MSKEEIEEYEDENEDLEDIFQDKVERYSKGQIRFRSVNHSERALANGVATDEEMATFINYALEYFGHRCALSGERLVIFDEPVKREKGKRIVTNLSAEHVVALSIGGNDIIPNVVPTVLQYNVQKNGYYILDWWPKARNNVGEPIYSEERLLKLVNYMLKSLQIRKELGIKERPREYKKRILTPNVIDEYLEQEEIAKRLISEVITTTQDSIDGKKILTKIPTMEGAIPSLAEQKESEISITEEMFIIDAIELLEKGKNIPQEVIECLKNLYKEVEGEISFEIEVRSIILKTLEEMGLKENKYTVTNSLLINTELLEQARENKEKIHDIVKDFLKKKIEELREIIPIEFIYEIISYNPEIIYSKEAAEEQREVIELYKKYVNSEQIDIKKLKQPYYINILKIKEWMSRQQNPTRPPRAQKRNRIPEEEARLGNALSTIRQILIKKYTKLKTEDEKRKYRIQYPEVEDVMRMVEEIDRNNVPRKEEQPYYINMLEIVEWMSRQQNPTRPPRAQNRNRIPEEEAKLGEALSSIRRNLINPYIELEKEGKDAEDEKREYRIQHPEVEDVMRMVEEIDRNNVPRKEEQPYYINMLEIKEWMSRQQNPTRPPRVQDRNRIPEEEARLGKALSSIRRNLINPYIELEKEGKDTEDAKREYIRKHPEVEDVMRMVEEIDRNNVPRKEEQPNYINMLEIVEWMSRQQNPTRPPRAQNRNRIPEEEARLGTALSSIRRNLINPYIELEKEGKDAEDAKREYIRKHPEVEDVMRMVEEIDRNNVPRKEEQPNYINMLEIVEWMSRQQNPTRPPRGQNRNRIPEEEARLGNALRSIRRQLINPYIELEKEGKDAEDEKREYRIQHPEVEEVMRMVEEIDRNKPALLQTQERYRQAKEENAGATSEKQEAEQEKESAKGQRDLARRKEQRLQQELQQLQEHTQSKNGEEATR